MIISGESGGVSGSIISSLKERLEVRMYGTLMKVVCSGKHFQTKDFANGLSSVTV